jgi:hypothetical protein
MGSKRLKGPKERIKEAFVKLMSLEKKMLNAL